MLKFLKLTTALTTTLLVGGCNLGPDFTPPDAKLPPVSFEGNGRIDSLTHLPPATDAKWWIIFKDPTLTRLETRVAEANLDVQTATIRLAESRFQRGVAAAAELPSLNGTARYQRELYSQNGIFSLIGGLLGGQGGGAAGGAGGGTNGLTIQPISEYNVGFDASWELDLWGRVRRQVESADAQVEVSEDARRDTLVSTLAELARDYVQLRGTQTLLKIANDNLKIEQDILQLTQTRQQKGLTTGLDVENAAAQVESIRAQVPTLQQQESEGINALCLLLDLPPSALRAELGSAKPVPPSPPRVPVGIPSELARRRPDIRRAEAQLHAATADIGVAVASFYPTVQLNGTVGFDALDLKNLWKGSSLQYMLGPSVSLPIFEGGRLRSMLELRKSQQQEAAIAYHQTVLRAWHDVVNALVAHRLEQVRRERLAQQVEHSRQALGLARSRYNDGVADFTTVLDTERTLLQAQQQYAQSTTNVSLNLIRLYKALGGGWELTFPSVVAVPDASVVTTKTVENAK